MKRSSHELNHTRNARNVNNYFANIFEGTDKPSNTALSLLTFCVLVLKNGFTVTGESACVSPENFDAAIGRKIAREKAVEKVWPLLGFMLRDMIYEQNHRNERESQ